MKLPVSPALAISVCLLAACSQKPAGPAGSAGVAAQDVETPIVDLPGMPHMAVGYWERTAKEGDKAPVTTRFCQADLPLWGRIQDSTGCTVQSFKRNGRGDIIDYATCSENGYSSFERLAYHGDLKQAFVTDEVDRTTGSTQEPKSDTWHESYRLLGPCPAGSAPPK
jgi:hypothetical protein